MSNEPTNDAVTGDEGPANDPRLHPDPALQGLTWTEHHALELTTDLWSALMQIVEHGPTRDQDLTDLGVHIHAIQRTIMAQAAGRAYPSRYRLLGEVLG